MSHIARPRCTHTERDGAFRCRKRRLKRRRLCRVHGRKPATPQAHNPEKLARKREKAARDRMSRARAAELLRERRRFVPYLRKLFAEGAGLVKR